MAYPKSARSKFFVIPSMISSQIPFHDFIHDPIKKPCHPTSSRCAISHKKTSFIFCPSNKRCFLIVWTNMRLNMINMLLPGSYHHPSYHPIFKIFNMNLQHHHTLFFLFYICHFGFHCLYYEIVFIVSKSKVRFFKKIRFIWTKRYCTKNQ